MRVSKLKGFAEEQISNGAVRLEHICQLAHTPRINRHGQRINALEVHVRRTGMFSNIKCHVTATMTQLADQEDLKEVYASVYCTM